MDALTPEYITTVAKRVHPTLTLDPTTIAYLQFLLTPYAQAIEQADSLESVYAWLELAFPGELKIHAKAEAEKAVDKAGEVDDVEKLKVGRRSTIEYLADELIDLAGNRARDHKDTIVLPWDLKLAITTDKELEETFKQDGTQGLVVTVRIGANDSPHALSEDFVAGILLYYHAAGKPINLFLYGAPLAADYLTNPDGTRHDEDNAREIADGPNYLIDVGGTTYSFRTADFIQGANSAAMWLGEDYHTRVTNLRTFNLEGEEHPLTF